MRLLKRILKQQTGQALPLALVLLLFGGFFVVPCLALMSTSLNANRMVDQATLGLYAADSGVEDAIRQLKYTESGPLPSYNLGEKVNSMNVEVVTNEEGTYTLYADALVEMTIHAGYLEVNGNMEWDPDYGGGAYKYTITLTVTEEVPGVGQKIFLAEVGAKLPAGFTYEAESAALFLENLYCGPDDEHLPDLDVAEDGAQMVNWVLPTPRPHVRNSYAETATQAFYLTGSGGGGGDYAWIKGASADIGMVSEITGTLYIITTTAAQGGEPTVIVKVETGVLRQGSTSPYDIEIVSWQVTK